MDSSPSLKELLRKALESGELAQRLLELKSRTEMGRSRLQEMETTLDSLRQVLDTAKEDLSASPEQAHTAQTWELLGELAKQPAFQQLAQEILAGLLRDQPSQPPQPAQ